MSDAAAEAQELKGGHAPAVKVYIFIAVLLVPMG